MYISGEGVKRDGAEAVRWWMKAAEQGDSVAQYNVGQSYLQGDGVGQDFTEAARWYRRAAEQGNSGAICTGRGRGPAG